MVALEKLQSKEIYSLIISQNMRIPTLEQYFKTLFPHLNLDWKLIYLLPRVLTKNTSLRAFQYNVLNNVLYLNHKLFNQHDETVQYLFSTCNELISLWTETKLYFVNNIKTIALCPILDYTNIADRCFITQNLISLILKFYVIHQQAKVTWVLVLSFIKS